MNTLKFTFAAAVTGCVLAGSAVAMPADRLSAPAASFVEHAAWVCGPYRCWWRPGPPWLVPGPPPWAWRHHWW